MSLAFDPSSVFSQAIEDHLAVIDLLRDQLNELITAFSDCEWDTPIWTWVFDRPEGAIFWARRMAHESSVQSRRRGGSRVIVRAGGVLQRPRGQSGA